jgi:transposase
MRVKKESSSESIVREIKRQTRRKFNPEEKIRIVLEGLRGEGGITDLWRRESIHPTMYCKWSKAFLEARKRQLTGDTLREVSSDEVNEIRGEDEALKQLVADGQHGLSIDLFFSSLSSINLSKERIQAYDRHRHQEQDTPQNLVAALRDPSPAFPLAGLADDGIEAGQGEGSPSASSHVINIMDSW